MCRRPVAAEEWCRLDAWGAAQEAEAPTILAIGAGSAAGGFLQAVAQLRGAAGQAARIVAVHVVEDAAADWAAALAMAGAAACWGTRALQLFQE
eukprot:15404773-Alexandrium_andersonii.AAC.1